MTNLVHNATFRSARALARVGWLVFLLSVVLMTGLHLDLSAAQQERSIAAVWANNGEDKVTQDELRASADPGSVLNSVWDGETISLFGARNEVVAFNLILEAPSAAATGVTVTFDTLAGPDGYAIHAEPASGDGIFDWTDRPIELFYVRYLEIRGLTTLLYQHYDERHIPERLRRPWNGDGHAEGTWEDRPDHNRFYPDIAVPLELVPRFDIAAGQNQSIWVDVYIPRDAPTGLYTGTVTVAEGEAVTHTVPVALAVRDFTLPDVPGAPTMLYIGDDDINLRYVGEEYPAPNSDAGRRAALAVDRHFLLAHRHRISLIGAGEYADGETDQPDPAWLPRLDGSLFTPENGYDGPGVGVGNGVYSIGTYGLWAWRDEDDAAMWQHTDAWVTWFEANFPDTAYFLYLIDESDDYPQIERWAQWIDANPGPGSRLLSLATIDLPDAAAFTPALDIVASWAGSFGLPEVWTEAADQYRSDPNRQLFVYNGFRPASGSFATEDEGVALRTLGWIQFKLGIDRWFHWEATYYNNFHGNTGQTNVFQTAQTFGDHDGFDEALGETGWLYSNGDGVLMYPGTDTVYPAESYGVLGPFASLRLKHWRRGIQDVDYLRMAAAIDPQRVADIVEALIPAVLWEIGVEDPNDPTWVLTDISWPTDPDVWETARADLADIIEGGE